LTVDDDLPVVTGFGAVSAIGVGAEAFWRGIQAGRQAARPVQAFDTSAMRNRVACEIDDAQLPPAPGSDGGAVPRASYLAMLAAGEALATAGLEATAVEGLCVGTTMGDLPSIEAQLACTDGTAWSLAHDALRSTFAGRIAEAVGIQGPAVTIATSCSAGNVAICRAADLITSGGCEAMLAGGAEAFSRVAFIGFSRMRAMAPERCTPFARDRKGMLLGEGAAFLLLESLRAARARGARIYAAIAGYGLSCDAYHVATPDPSGRGAAAAMRQALERAGLAAVDVDYVSALGTGTLANDLAESRACRLVFDGRQPYLSSIKALIGHSLGAASALEAVAAVLSLRDRRLVPAWNVDVPDPQCEVAIPYPEICADPPPRLDVVLSNAFAFGGNNSCLALRRWE
jgi:3-oxoacyl-[acyl-carrier-protein] synthase II